MCPLKTKSDENNEDGNNSKPANGSNISWLNKFMVHTVSNKCSRNNTPSRAHLITKIVRQNCYAENQLILVACEQKNSIACACAVARSFPLFSAKTTNNEAKKSRNVSVTFIYTDDVSSNGIYPTQDEVDCFNAVAQSVRLTAKIIDMPCADMTTDHFLEVIQTLTYKS